MNFDSLLTLCNIVVLMRKYWCSVFKLKIVLTKLISECVWVCVCLIVSEDHYFFWESCIFIDSRCRRTQELSSMDDCRDGQRSQSARWIQHTHVCVCWHWNHLSLNSMKAVPHEDPCKDVSLRCTYLIGRSVLCCGVVLPICSCIMSFSKFHEPNTHDLLRTSREDVTRKMVPWNYSITEWWSWHPRWLLCVTVFVVDNSKITGLGWFWTSLILWLALVESIYLAEEQKTMQCG